MELRNRLREEKWNFKSLSLCSEMGQRGLPGPSSAIIIYRTSKEFYTLYVWNTLYAHTSDNCLVLFRRQTPSTSWDTDAALFMYFNCTLPTDLLIAIGKVKVYIAQWSYKSGCQHFLSIVICDIIHIIDNTLILTVQIIDRKDIKKYIVNCLLTRSFLLHILTFIKICKANYFLDDFATCINKSKN